MNTVYVTDVLPQVGTPIIGGNPTVDFDREKAPVVGAGSSDFGGSQMHYTVNDRSAVEEGGKLNMEVVYEMNTVLQVSTPINGGNPTDDSDRVKAPVVGAGPTDFGGRGAHTLPKTEDNFKRLRENIDSLVKFILEKKNIHTEIKRRAKNTARVLKEYAKTPQKACSAQAAQPSKDEAVQTSLLFGKQGAPRAPPNHEKRSPPTDKEKKKARTQKPRNGELPQPVTGAPEHQCTDADWVTIVKKKARKKTGDASKPNISNAQRQTGLRPARLDAFKIKASGETSYADIIRRVKSAPDLKVLGERVTRIRRT